MRLEATERPKLSYAGPQVEGYTLAYRRGKFGSRECGDAPVVICMWTAPCVSDSNNHLTAIRRRGRAPSTTSTPDLSVWALMSALAGCGHAVAWAYTPRAVAA